MAPVHVGNSVMLSQPGIHERVVGPEEVEDAAVFTHLALEEQLRLLDHRFAQGAVETGKP